VHLKAVVVATLGQVLLTSRWQRCSETPVRPVESICQFNATRSRSGARQQYRVDRQSTPDERGVVESRDWDGSMYRD